MKLEELSINELYELRKHTVDEVMGYLRVSSPLRFEGALSKSPDVQGNDEYRSLYMKEYERNVSLLKKIAIRMDFVLEQLNQ